LADLSKFEIFLQELSSVEVQASAQMELYEELLKRTRELEKKISSLQKENEYLKLQSAESRENGEAQDGQKAQENIFGSLSVKERENLKVQITDVITKINNHLTSS